jgi:hypothetical protein
MLLQANLPKDAFSERAIAVRGWFSASHDDKLAISEKLAQGLSLVF